MASLSIVSLILRGLLGLGGVLLVVQAWPVARASWYSQQADRVIGELRGGRPINLPGTQAAIAALDRAIGIGASPSRLLDRSELLHGAALGLNWAAPDSDRRKWIEIAEGDLVTALGRAPAKGIAWLRLAAIRLDLEGPSQRGVLPLMMSIETAPVIPRLWAMRLRLILAYWPAFTDEQRQLVGEHVVMTWQATSDRRWFASVLQDPLDELCLRVMLADVPNAQDELSGWILLGRVR
jgi:hypothetical protein